MSMVQRGWVLGAAVLAAGVAGILPAAAAPGRPGSKESTNALPSFADGPAKRKSVVYTNDVYEAWLSPNGYLSVTLQKGGKPAGPTFRLFNATFWGRDVKGGYVFKDEPEIMEPESAMPALQPKEPVKFSFGMEKDAKGSVEFVFGPSSISVDVKFRPTASGEISTLRPSAYFLNLPGLKTGAVDTNVDVAAVCEGKVVVMMPDPKTTTTLGFAEEAGRPAPCPEWVVRGLWDGYLVRGKVDSKSDTYQFWQYGGTIPANGFGFHYNLSKTLNSRKVSFHFEDPNAPAVPPGPATRVPGPVRGRRP
ncbi:MAG: hypothetical protein FJ221_13455 [Lentisphaerae bacterium]|nr:hypothetical protein [Lentisphaerota bacterium]